jgi:8-oxo-dGTP pyrophosphatase MutT (NUDIX family)
MPIHFKYLISWRKNHQYQIENYYQKKLFFNNKLNDIFFKNTTFIWRSFKNILNKTNYNYINKTNLELTENVTPFQASMYYPNYHMFNKTKKEDNIDNNKIYYKRCGTIIIIIKNNIKFLVVVKGYGGKWSLPKGKPNPKETDEECAIRETYEETNIKLNYLTNCEKVKFGKNTYFVYYMSEHIFNQQNLVSNDPDEVEIVDIVNIENIFLLDCNKDLRSLIKIVKNF